MIMNSKEIVLANIELNNPPRPGLNFDRGRLSDLVYADLSPYGFNQKRWVEGEREYYDDEWGNLWHRMINGSKKGEIIKPFLKNWDDLNRIQPPDYSHSKCKENAESVFSQSSDKFKIVVMGGWVFDNARYLRDMAVYLYDMAANPDQLQDLHAIIAEVYEQKICLAGEAGADAIFLAEDLGTETGLLFSPKMFRKFFKEMYTKLFQLAHDYGMKVIMHSCGQNRKILPDLLEAGVNVFQFDQPLLYDMEELASLLRKHRAALFSPVDIQKALPTGNKEVILNSARKMLELFWGGLICKNYLDLSGIGVEEQWDDWAYVAILEYICDKINKSQ